MRVRGLKLDECSPDHPSAQSHPVRVRGLKHSPLPMSPQTAMSHPVRVRGLKRLVNNYNTDSDFVAPRAGAWVET